MLASSQPTVVNSHQHLVEQESLVEDRLQLCVPSTNPASPDVHHPAALKPCLVGSNPEQPDVGPSHPAQDLSGWNIRSMACGPAVFAVAADSSVITWGSATNGELAYGSSGKKSSANPDKVGQLGSSFAWSVVTTGHLVFTPGRLCFGFVLPLGQGYKGLEGPKPWEARRTPGTSDRLRSSCNWV